MPLRTTLTHKQQWRRVSPGSGRTPSHVKETEEYIIQPIISARVSSDGALRRLSFSAVKPPALLPPSSSSTPLISSFSHKTSKESVRDTNSSRASSSSSLKSLQFSSTKQVVMIPSRSEMSQDLFWSAKELQRFKKEAMSQIEILVLTKSISFDDAKKELYQPKRELLNNSLNSVKESSSTTSSEDDYFIADTALALEEEEEDAENSLSSSSDLDDIEANLLYELQQSDYLRERGGKLKFSWAVF